MMNDITHVKQNRDQLICYIKLTLVPGTGPVTQNLLLNLAGDARACFTMEPQQLLELSKAAGTAEAQIHRIRQFLDLRSDKSIQQQAEKILADCQKQEISLITITMDQYPNRFHGLDGMPVLLYTRGTLKINSYPHSIGVVGSRRCSPEGKQQTIEVVTEAVSRSTAIISGMAKGIDSYAHTAAIKSGGYTIAVLGNGPDICYPKEHRPLYERIAQEGCILSEYPPGREPQKYAFPNRNRLIAALSDELHVTECGKRSGTESTIKACRKWGRAVIQKEIQKDFTPN